MIFMKMNEKYPQANQLLSCITDLCRQITMMENYLENERSSVFSCTAKYSKTVGKSVITREDHECRAIDTQHDLDTLKMRLDVQRNRLEQVLQYFHNPTDALFLRLLYVYGTNKTLVRSLSGLSMSGFYARLERGMMELDRVLQRSDAA